MTTRHAVLHRSAEDLSCLSDGSVDLVVTSPPYPMIEMWDRHFSAGDHRIADRIADGDGAAAFELMHRLLDRVWSECARVVRPGGFVCINIGEATRTIGSNFRTYTNHARVIGAFESLGFQSLPPVIWRKPTNAPNKFMGSGTLPAGAYVTLEHEYVLIFRNGRKRHFSAVDGERRRRSAFFWEERNTWFSDLWELGGARQQLTGPTASVRRRSAAFPFELPFRLINMYSMQEDLVLDPFAGTGTTSLAAIAAGRHSLGVEIDVSLGDSVTETVRTGTVTINERQIDRVRNHLEFVEGYERTKGRPPGYLNEIHRFPVVTRQERHLTIPVVERIRCIPGDDASYEVRHGIYGGDTPPGVPVEG
ncbi:MAG: DNA-methyltransferase [Alkalispirochaeta sp.]